MTDTRDTSPAPEKQAPEKQTPEAQASKKQTAKAQTAKKQDPLHGVKLEQILNELVAEYDWSGLHQRIAINCFKSEPSVKSSLKFLRKTPWARQKVESLYLKMKGFSAAKRATKTEAVLEAEVKQALAANRKKPAEQNSRSKQTSAGAKVNPWANAGKKA